jgi:hypothetical protein
MKGFGEEKGTGNETVRTAAALQEEPRNSCTRVQVFHSEYREKEAKRMAKVEGKLTLLYSIVYIV